MSESLSTELSYGELLGYPAEGDTLSITNEREPTEPAEDLPDSSDTHASSTVPDPQIDNGLSLVSASSLDPKRRTRHHGRHSHMHRDFAHMLSVSARDAKELRRGLDAAYNKLDQSRERASHAEKLALDMLLRVREAEEERERAMREASAVREELGRYKALLDSAHKDIRRGQSLLQDQEHLRYEAEAAAARARDTARQMKQRRLIELAREQGRKMGYDEGVQAGQRIGYYDGQSPGDDTKVYFNEGPRFHEFFDESNYRLDNFDRPPPVQPNPSSTNDPGVPLAPQATHPPYTNSQAQYDGVPAIPHNTSTPPSEVPYTTPLMRVSRPPSTGSSSTTTLPVAPVPLRAMSRAPPTMPTIPEVASTEVGSTSWSRSQRDSPRMHGHIQPAPQAAAYDVVLPSIVPHLQDPATFEPPPGSVGVSPLASPHNHVLPSVVHPLQDRADFEPPPGSVGVSLAPAPQLSLHDVAFPSIVPAPQDRTAFQPPPGSVGMSPALALQASHDTVLPSIVSPPQDRGTFQPPPGSVYEAPSTPVNGHPQRPGEQPVYPLPSPRGARRGGYDYFSNANEGIRSPVQERFASSPRATPSQGQEHHAGHPGHFPSTVQERFASAPEATRSQVQGHRAGPPGNSPSIAQERFASASGATTSQVQGHHAGPPGNSPSTVQEYFSSSSEYAPSRVRERNPSTHSSTGSRRTSRTRAESIQLADELRNPENLTRVRSDGSTPRRDGPPKRRPVPQMPAPLAPQSAPNMSYGQGPRGSVRHMQPSGFDYGVPSDAGMNAGPNTAVDRRRSLPRAVPSSAERSIDRAPAHSGAASHQSYGGQHPGPGTVRDPHPQAAPYFIPNDPAGQQAAPQNHSSRGHVQIPPTTYYAPDPASHLANSPTMSDQVQPTDTYSPGAAPFGPNPNVSDSRVQSPPRYPPTLYNEPMLQQQSSRSADYQQEETASSPTLPVPSRNSRATSHMMIPPPTPSRRNSYATRQGIVADSPRTPTDALPIPPPSLSPHPSPAAFPRQIPPPQGASTPGRPTSPNPLPRSSSPAPLLRASSPAPLPVRSPSMRSVKMHGSTSDVSLPHGSPYMHYNPKLEANIAVLASSSAEALAAPTR
ncbi:hypothetical protein EDB85DRAFT_1906628 [Lactarius pseudohatsudake]|nr:hypothetical protein EDB85DRAFT_1906628 [Lactarius pseudohatsudake]